MEEPDGGPMDTGESSSASRTKRPLSPPSSSVSGSRRRLPSPDEVDSFAAAIIEEACQNLPEDVEFEDQAVDSGEAETFTPTEDRVVYMLVSLATGPISYSLYPLRVPKLGISPPTLVPCNVGDNSVYPVIELRRDDYPELMCCQKLGSILYLLGGMRWVDDDDIDDERFSLPDIEYPETVYSIDTSLISPSSHGIDPNTLLTECKSMNSGKPHCQAFVVDNMLYAISCCSLGDCNITRFERFDPDSGIWSILPDPPFKCGISSDAIVKNKLMLGTSDGYVYLFDVKELTWINISLYFRGLSFEGHCTVLDDILYSFTYRTLFAFGPTTMEDINNKVTGLFKKAAFVAMPLYDIILDNIPPQQPCVLFNHWGKRVFCLGIVGPLQATDGNMYSRDPEKGCMSVIIFRVPNKQFKPPPIDSETPCFEANLLHEASYVFKSSNEAEADSPFLLGCFSNFTGDDE